MLAGTRLRDQTGFAHLLCKQRLPETVIDLVRTGVVQVLPLQINLRAAKVLRHFLRVIQAARPSGIVMVECRQLPAEFRVLLVVIIGLLQLDHRVHQCLRDILPSVYPEPSARIRTHPPLLPIRPAAFYAGHDVLRLKHFNRIRHVTAASYAGYDVLPALRSAPDLISRTAAANRFTFSASL